MIGYWVNGWLFVESTDVGVGIDTFIWILCTRSTSMSLLRFWSGSGCHVNVLGLVGGGTVYIFLLVLSASLSECSVSFLIIFSLLTWEGRWHHVWGVLVIMRGKIVLFLSLSLLFRVLSNPPKFLLSCSWGSLSILDYHFLILIHNLSIGSNLELRLWARFLLFWRGSSWIPHKLNLNI